MIAEVYRVLSKNGVYIVVSYGTPENRMSFLDKDEYDWVVSYDTISKPYVS